METFNCGVIVLVTLSIGAKAEITSDSGAVIQINSSDLQVVMETLKKYSLDQSAVVLGETTPSKQITIKTNHADAEIFALRALREMWSELSFRMQSLRDNPESAKEAFNSLLDDDNPGSSSKITFSQPNKEDLMKF